MLGSSKGTEGHRGKVSGASGEGQGSKKVCWKPIVEQHFGSKVSGKGQPKKLHPHFLALEEIPPKVMETSSGYASSSSSLSSFSVSRAIQVNVSKEKGSYESVMLSLQSPLPNEHQFALDTLLALSSERDLLASRGLNAIANTPGLLNILLAHCGFYRDCGFRALHEETYKQAFGQNMNFSAFWEQIVTESVGPELLCECFPGKLEHLPEMERQILVGMGCMDELKCCGGCRALNVDRDEELSTIKVAPKLVGDRVLLVATILRNFSFGIDNRVVMVNNSTLLRFVLVAAQSEYSNLRQTAVDIITNIFKNKKDKKDDKTMIYDPEVVAKLKRELQKLVVSTVHQSKDRFKIMRALETITGWAWEEDKPFLESVDLPFLKRLFDLMLLKDFTFLLVHCLDCALALTASSKKACDNLVLVPGSLKTLMAYLAKDIIGTGTGDVIQRSVNLTAALVIRNIVKNISRDGRIKLRQFEYRFAEIAMSNDEKSWVFVEILQYMTDWVDKYPVACGGKPKGEDSLNQNVTQKPLVNSETLKLACNQLLDMYLEEECSKMGKDIIGIQIQKGELGGVLGIQKEFLVCKPGMDLLGNPLGKVYHFECECPKCHMKLTALSFTAHLEICMGMVGGQCSSRITSRPLAAVSSIAIATNNSAGESSKNVEEASVVSGPSDNPLSTQTCVDSNEELRSGDIHTAANDEVCSLERMKTYVTLKRKAPIGNNEDSDE